jgi:2-methylfumaryl-CoA isomerase
LAEPLLSPLRVIELSAFIAAPYAGLLLAQHGADVIRVDPIGGGPDIQRWPLAADGTSLYWAGLNKRKRSVAVDTRSPRGRELVAALITREDAAGGVVLTNLAARGELAHERLVASRPDLIALYLKGQYDNQTAVDYTVNSAVGVPFATGEATPDRPINNMLPAWDALAGAQAALALGLAHARRQRSGLGDRIDLALGDVAYAFVSHIGITAEAELYGRERPACGNHVYGSLGRDLATADGRRLMFACVTTNQWRAMVAATGTAEAITALERALGLDFNAESARWESRELLVAMFEQWTRRRPLDEIRPIFDQHGVCWGPYQSFRQLVDEDPRFTDANPLIATIEQPGIGRIRVAGLPATFASRTDRGIGPGPRLGQHTEEVLTSLLGLSTAQFGRLADDGIVRQHP